MKNHEPSFADRLSTATRAREAQLKKARAKAPALDPGFAERQAARRAVSVAREARVAEGKAAKLAEKTRKAAEATARAIALDAEREARKAEAAEEAARAIALKAEAAAREIELLAEQKAARDARYVARKARQR